MKPFSQVRNILACIFAAAIFSLLISSCVTTSAVRVELGTAAPVYPPTAESQWAVLTWMLESDEGQLLSFDREQAEAIRHKTGYVVFTNWSQRMAAEFPFITVLNGDLFFTGGQADNDVLMEAIDKLERPIPVLATVDESLAFSWATGLYNSGFRLWLDDNINDLTLPEGRYGNRELAIKKLKKANEAYIVQRITAEASQYSARSEYRSAFDILRKRVSDFPENETLLQQTAVVAERLVDSQLQGFVQSHIRPVQTSLAKLAGNAAEFANSGVLVDAAEKAFLSLFNSWNDDSFLTAALEKNGQKFDQVHKDLAVSRVTFWQHEIKNLTAKDHYWRAFNQFKTRFEDASQYASPTRELITARLWQEYLAVLPSAVNHFLVTGKREMENAERFGTALILFDMVGKYIAFARENDQTVPDSLLTLETQVEQLNQESLVFFETWVKRSLILSEFASGEAGLGTTFLRDLENLFSRNLRSNELVYGVTTHDDTQDAEKSDYVLHKCNVAAFEVDMGQPEESLELLSRRGEVLEEDNPEYLDRVKKEMVTTGIPEKIFSQRIYRYTKHTRIQDIVVHSRITFMMLNQSKNKFFEINKFMKKRFTQERIDPRETIVKIEKVSGQEEPEPDLRNERVWVNSEMKDWARKQAQEIVAMNVMREIAAYPHSLVELAVGFEEKDQWQVASNFWGFCYEYMNRINPEPNRIKDRLENETLLDHMFLEVKENLRTSQKLEKLKRNVWDNAANAVLAYLES